MRPRRHEKGIAGARNAIADSATLCSSLARRERFQVSEGKVYE